MLSKFHTGKSSSRSVGLLPSVRNLDNTSAAWCLAPARWAQLMSSSDIRRRYRASHSDASNRLRTQFSESWSAQIVNCVPSECGQRILTAYTIARNFCSVVPCRRSALVWEVDKYPTGLVLSLDYHCNNTHASWTSPVSVSSFIFPSPDGNANTGD